MPEPQQPPPRTRAVRVGPVTPAQPLAPLPPVTPRPAPPAARPGRLEAPQPTPPPIPAVTLTQPRWSGSTAAALVHGVIGLCLGVALVREPPGGYTFPVFAGPKRVTEWLPGDPLTAWGLLYLVPAVVVLAGQGRPWTKWALLVQSATLATFGVPALAIGVTSSQAASLAGVYGIGLAVLCLHAALSLGRRR